MHPPVDSVLPRVAPAALSWHGKGLVRPECVLAAARGDLYTAGWRGGVTHLRPDGTQSLYAGTLPVPVPVPAGRPARPNGIALRANGNFLLADLGEEQGGVVELTRAGAVREVLTRVDGQNLPPSNFVTEDAQGRMWLMVSTRLAPRALAYNNRVADELIVLMDAKVARIVADGTGAFPDGFAFDSEGGIWVACIVGNQHIRIRADGSQHVVLEDGDAEYVRLVEDAYARAALDRSHMDRRHTTTLQNISSVAFGGPDLKTVFLGCLVGDAVASFRLPDDVALCGHPPVHWRH